MLIKEAYEQGIIAALEKLGAPFISAGQTAGAAVDKSLVPKFMKSFDNPAGVNTKDINRVMSPKRGQPGNVFNPAIKGKL